MRLKMLRMAWMGFLSMARRCFCHCISLLWSKAGDAHWLSHSLES